MRWVDVTVEVELALPGKGQRPIRVERVIHCFFLIARIDVHGVAEYSLPKHVEHAHHFSEIAVIFQLYAVPARVFRRLHHLPAFVDRECGGLFRRRVFAGAQGGYAHGRVPFPGSRGDKEIDVVTVTKPQIVCLSSITRRLGAPGFLDGALRCRNAFRDQISDSHDPASLHSEELPQNRAASIPHAD